jgi:hypothetical protein
MGENTAVMRTKTLEIAGGVRVVVSDSVNLLTPYVFFEQRDWFEDDRLSSLIAGPWAKDN